MKEAVRRTSAEVSFSSDGFCTHNTGEKVRSEHVSGSPSTTRDIYVGESLLGICTVCKREGVVRQLPGRL